MQIIDIKFRAEQIANLRKDQCKFIGDDGIFCKDNIYRDKVYCQNHCETCFRGGINIYSFYRAGAIMPDTYNLTIAEKKSRTGRYVTRHLCFDTIEERESVIKLYKNKKNKIQYEDSGEVTITVK